jgi:hypothetical protein
VCASSVHKAEGILMTFYRHYCQRKWNSLERGILKKYLYWTLWHFLDAQQHQCNLLLQDNDLSHRECTYLFYFFLWEIIVCVCVSGTSPAIIIISFLLHSNHSALMITQTHNTLYVTCFQRIRTVLVIYSPQCSS